MDDVQMNLAILRLVQNSGMCIKILQYFLGDLNDSAREASGDIVVFTKDEINIMNDALVSVIMKLSVEN